jgi:hypothetical protein
MDSIEQRFGAWQICGGSSKAQAFDWSGAAVIAAIPSVHHRPQSCAPGTLRIAGTPASSSGHGL